MMRRVRERARERRGLGCEERIGDESSKSKMIMHREEETGVVPHFMESVLDLRRAGRGRLALTTALACAGLHPLDPYYYKPLVYSLTPEVLIEYYRRKKGKSHE